MLFQQACLGPVDKHQECPRNLFPLETRRRALRTSPSPTALYILFSTPAGKSMQFRTPLPRHSSTEGCHSTSGQRREVAVDISISKFHKKGMIVPTPQPSCSTLFPSCPPEGCPKNSGRGGGEVGGSLDTQLCGWLKLETHLESRWGQLPLTTASPGLGPGPSTTGLQPSGDLLRELTHDLGCLLLPLTPCWDPSMITLGHPCALAQPGPEHVTVSPHSFRHEAAPPPCPKSHRPLPTGWDEQGRLWGPHTP